MKKDPNIATGKSNNPTVDNVVENTVFIKSGKYCKKTKHKKKKKT